MAFEDFRQWALESSRAAAFRWEEPDDDEIQVLLALDDYGAHHVIPVPPFYLKLERGHVYWLRTLPNIASNRSLVRLAYRTSAWASTDPKYADQPVDDPKRLEMLMLHIAEKGRYEVWNAEIRRSTAGLPSIREWKIQATDKEGLSGALPKHIRAAVDSWQDRRGPTMPAADMVLGPWDVPDDFLPLEQASGPLGHPDNPTLSSYVAVYRPEKPGPIIVSQTLVFPTGDGARHHVAGAVQALVETGNRELDGIQIGDESHYFSGQLDAGRLNRWTALWRYADVFCEVGIAGPPGRYTKSQLDEYAQKQDRRARAALEGALADH